MYFSPNGFGLPFVLYVKGSSKQSSEAHVHILSVVVVNLQEY